MTNTTQFEDDNLGNCNILLIRHGETDWNAEKRLQGHVDIELNTNGRQQIREEVEKIKLFFKNEDIPFARKIISTNTVINELNIGSVYSSPLKRCRESCAIFCQQIGYPEQEINIVENLIEMNFGFLEGERYDCLKSKYPNDWLVLSRSTDLDFKIGSGESLSEKYYRVVTCIEEIARKHPGQLICIVTHSGVLSDIYKKSIMNHHGHIPKKNASSHLINLTWNKNDSLTWKILKWNITNL